MNKSKVDEGKVDACTSALREIAESLSYASIPALQRLAGFCAEAVLFENWWTIDDKCRNPVIVLCQQRMRSSASRREVRALEDARGRYGDLAKILTRIHEMPFADGDYCTLRDYASGNAIEMTSSVHSIVLVGQDSTTLANALSNAVSDECEGVSELVDTVMSLHIDSFWAALERACAIVRHGLPIYEDVNGSMCQVPSTDPDIIYMSLKNKYSEPPKPHDRKSGMFPVWLPSKWMVKVSHIVAHNERFPRQSLHRHYSEKQIAPLREAFLADIGCTNLPVAGSTTNGRTVDWENMPEKLRFAIEAWEAAVAAKKLDKNGNTKKIGNVTTGHWLTKWLQERGVQKTPAKKIAELVNFAGRGQPGYE